MHHLRAWPLVGALVACGGRETPFDEGLEPLEPMEIAAPDGGVEGFNIQVEEGDAYIWGHLRGHVHGDVADVWAAYQDVDVVVDRRRVAEWTGREGVEEEYDFSLAIDHVVEDTITITYTVTWRHGAVGRTEDPDKVSMRWQKTEGSSLLDILRGSVVLLPTDSPGVTEVQMIEHLKAPLTDTSEVENLLSDMFASVVAHVHGAPLPTYE